METGEALGWGSEAWAWTKTSLEPLVQLSQAGVSGLGGSRGGRPQAGLTLPFCPLQKRNRAITARRQHLKVGAAVGVQVWDGSVGSEQPHTMPLPPQSVMLQIAATELEKEETRRESEKQNYLSEHCPPLHIPGSMSEVQVPAACSRVPLPQPPHSGQGRGGPARLEC